MSNFISKKQLADLIDKGLQTSGVKENSQYYIITDEEEGCLACALGLAYIGLLEDPEKAHHIYWDTPETGYVKLSQLLNIPQDLAWHINSQHAGEGIPARDIAAQLREEED